MTANITYFAHDLADAAIHRRVRMLVAGGANVAPIGFRRSPVAIKAIEGVRAIDLGRTEDGMLARRVLSIVAAMHELDAIADQIREADVLLARNLEMLVLATRARKHYAPQARLVYECLDIHRMLLSKGLGGILLRSLESRLWRDVDLLLTSSLDFVRNYFQPRGFTVPVKLAENKLLMLEDNGTRSPKRLPGPPWRIGWFGVIRCKHSLDILSSLVNSMGGVVEVIIRGRPSRAVFPDFEEVIAGRRHVHYAGPYRNPVDLADIYGDIHFAWVIDYYESGQNSAWLLPNRLYEGTFYGAVPIGLEKVETAAWLIQHGIGVVLGEPLEEQLGTFFRSLNREVYSRLAVAVSTLPLTDLANDQTDCRDLVEALCPSFIDRARVHRDDDKNGSSLGPNSSSLGARR